MQGFTLAAITDVEKTKLQRKEFQSQWTVKYRSRSAGQGACFKGVSRTITMQGSTLAAITDVEKTKLQLKNFQSQWTVKYRSRSAGQGACLKGKIISGIFTDVNKHSGSLCRKSAHTFKFAPLKPPAYLKSLQIEDLSVFFY